MGDKIQVSQIIFESFEEQHARQIMVPGTKPVITDAEIKFRNNLFPDVKLIINKNLRCTCCGASVKSSVVEGRPLCHRLLDTLVCQKCFNFYGDDDFSVDEDGSDKYCRWCGQGGKLFLCSKCTGAFCKKCLTRNISRREVAAIKNDNWECVCCNTQPILKQRAQCWAAKQFALEQRKKQFKSTVAHLVPQCSIDLTHSEEEMEEDGRL